MARRRLDVKTFATPNDLKAVASPPRLQVIQALYGFGQATVSQLAQATGLAIGSVSHHLRVLEAVDIARRVVEPSSPDRRQTWWEPAHRDGFNWPADIHESDWGAAGMRARWAAVQALDWESQRVPNEDLPESWRGVRVANDVSMRLTPEEVRQLREDVYQLLREYRDRGDAQAARGETENRRPFHVDVDGFPYRPPRRRA